MKLVTILKNTAADSFNYVVVAEFNDGSKEYLVLANIDNFLMKFEMAQKEMGRQRELHKKVIDVDQHQVLLAAVIELGHCYVVERVCCCVLQDRH